MDFNVLDFITNQFVLLFFAVVTGLLLGKVRFGKFCLGTSGSLFTGIITGWFIYLIYAVPYEGANNIPQYASRLLFNNVISKDFFLLTLMLFVASVGLLASKDLDKVIKKYGLKFLILGFIVPFTGAGVIYLLAKYFPGQNPFAISGVYTGALTSSPGLAAAIEAVSHSGKKAEALVGFGHAVGYSPGVIVVILFIRFIPRIAKIDVAKERSLFNKLLLNDNPNIKKEDNAGFDVIAFVFVCLAGYFLGSLKIYLGPMIKYFSLGATGGVLIAALLFGYWGRIGWFNFRMNRDILSAIRDLSLAFFLAIVGLRYGYTTINSLTTGGAILILISFICAAISIISGFLIGRYIFKLNWILLAGSLCGAMTSTPGLGIAVDATASDDVAIGYGAAYPFALFGMVIFTIILHTLPV